MISFPRRHNAGVLAVKNSNKHSLSKLIYLLVTMLLIMTLGKSCADNIPLPPPTTQGPSSIVVHQHLIPVENNITPVPSNATNGTIHKALSAEVLATYLAVDIVAAIIRLDTIRKVAPTLITDPGNRGTNGLLVAITLTDLGISAVSMTANVKDYQGDIKQARYLSGISSSIAIVTRILSIYLIGSAIANVRYMQEDFRRNGFVGTRYEKGLYAIPVVYAISIICGVLGEKSTHEDWGTHTPELLNTITFSTMIATAGLVNRVMARYADAIQGGVGAGSSKIDALSLYRRVMNSLCMQSIKKAANALFAAMLSTLTGLMTSQFPERDTTELS